MMTSSRRAYVWVWIPEQTSPVVAGLVERNDQDLYRFTYGRRYLTRPDAISLFPGELPLQPGSQEQADGTLPSCLRDASPDAWGRRVIINRLTGQKGETADGVNFNELVYLLESGSDRIGALDFQESATDYRPRESQAATLDALQEASAYVEAGEPLPPALDQAIQHGSSIGGARPKALLDDRDRKLVAKFSSSTDLYNVVKAEFVAMRLARQAGLDVAPVEMARSLGKDVLLVERFDRVKTTGGCRRRIVLSALTLLGLDEMMARYASYEDLAHRIRAEFDQPGQTLRELFGRIVFNVLCGNTDDHARNHAAFWDGVSYRLTPAYDICPQSRTGGEATQAMLFHGQERRSQLVHCLAAAGRLGLSHAQAREIINHQIATLHDHWGAVCDEAELSPVDRELLWGRQFLNPFALEGYTEA
ncbi:MULTISPECIES: type II toxin-antitoxin system HipA family toxin [unclassified Ectothiorhodospira]|uniref:type II toxin-antitoxin system HipA family toxin n=1 Tax=unclassified Ectothiorhodospira TaxID=2684909 RepID=UPI001EE80F5F|nr:MULTISPECIES: HipA domain-containing protein [unclassified Ectothiorhodospira]MCG5516536.1 type II toxin-antitoxin system HipA family toxin [Ectothiorhodospira sp. 9100]MCG5519265.1 type II toxin-antitoxin system HipA family toxin [Ectothiorhodospira sp. 9905]